MTNEQVLIGTSGWEYKDWAGDFYRGVKAQDHFSLYARHFRTVEINATFYRLPGLGAVHAWREKAPKGFVFAVKGSRFITHIKRLNQLHGSVDKFFRRIRPLGSKIGPFLWQLPPNFKKDLPRLTNFLRRLPKDFSHAFEFRHLSWLDPETKHLLRNFNAALVWVSSMKMPEDLSVTADFIYIRFHGLSGGPGHDYTPDELSPWAKQIREQAAAGRRIFAFFNNDSNVRAPKNADLLIDLCGGSSPNSTGRSDETMP